MTLPYGESVRAAVFEVIVRQAMAGASWRELCAGPMQVNRITSEQVIAEVERRRGGGDGMVGAMVPVPKKPSHDDIRAQVFEVIINHAMSQSGVPWREIYAEAMRASAIAPAQIQSEIDRRYKE